MNIKCFFGYHRYRVVGKCYKVIRRFNYCEILKYAVVECKGCHAIYLKNTSEYQTVWYDYLNSTIDQLKKDGWIPYEELMLTKGEYL